MPHPPSSSLTRQLIVPVVGLLLAAVLANVGFSAWLAAQRSAASALAQQSQVAAALKASRVSLSMPVLDALARLTGCHFILWNEGTKRGLSTLDPAALASLDDASLAAAIPQGTVLIADHRYSLGVVRSEGVRPETVLVLTPLRPIFLTTLETVWPVLAVAAATLTVLVPLGLRTTGKLAARIGAIERHVGRIAEGEFGQRLLPQSFADTQPADEISRLVAGVNQMSTTLGELRMSLIAGERQRLLGQLAAGFAHELRNAITGARLAIDLHRRRCGGPASDESLTIAVRQLDIVEEEVRGLLALGKISETTPAPLAVDSLLVEVRDLTNPRCEHAGVHLECVIPTGITILGRHDSLRAAMVNLTLNGIDAAGRGGIVRLSASVLDNRVELLVEDTGQGPPAAIRDTISEPFVTGKPEGIGLGLSVAKAVAEEHGGALEWRRAQSRTHFSICLPAATLAETSTAESLEITAAQNPQDQSA